MSDDKDAKMYSDDFNDWWFAYPRKVGKRKALGKWKTIVKEIAGEKGISRKGAIKWLLERTRAFALSDKGRSGRFCPYPETWLNQGRYDDDPAEWMDQEAIEDSRIPTDEDLANWRP